MTGAADDCGDRTADADFAEFVRSVTGSLHRTAYLLTGSRDSAEDCVQTALTRIYLAWDRRASWDNRNAYARRVVTNVVLSAARRRWRGEWPTAQLPEPRHPQSADGATAVDERDGLRRALLDLPVRQRTAVVLRHYLDLSEAEVAVTMGCPVGTVKSLNARALSALRTRLEEVAS